MKVLIEPKTHLICIFLAEELVSTMVVVLNGVLLLKDGVSDMVALTQSRSALNFLPNSNPVVNGGKLIIIFRSTNIRLETHLFFFFFAGRFTWFKGADNPTMSFKQVTCPKEIVARTGCERK